MNCSYAIANQSLEAAHGVYLAAEGSASDLAHTSVAVAIGRARSAYLELLEREDLPMKDETKRRLESMQKQEAAKFVQVEKIEEQVLDCNRTRLIRGG